MEMEEYLNDFDIFDFLDKGHAVKTAGRESHFRPAPNTFEEISDSCIIELQSENQILKNLLVEKEIEIYHLKKRI